MKFYEQKTYMDEDGCKIIELLTEGNYDLEDDVDPKQQPFNYKFLGIIPKPTIMDQLPLQIGDRLVGIPIMAIKDGFVPLKAQTIAEAFVEFQAVVKEIEMQLEQRAKEAAKPKLSLPPSVQGKKGLIV